MDRGHYMIPAIVLLLLVVIGVSVYSLRVSRRRAAMHFTLHITQYASADVHTIKAVSYTVVGRQVHMTTSTYSDTGPASDLSAPATKDYMLTEEVYTRVAGLVNNLESGIGNEQRTEKPAGGEQLSMAISMTAPRSFTFEITTYTSQLQYNKNADILYQVHKLLLQ